MSAPDPPPPESVRLLSGRYRVGPRLGRGGMAEVRDGFDERLQRAVAIKFLLPELAGDPDLRRRFEHEARSAARVAHPNVVAILDVGEEPDRTAWIIMERLPGRTLHDELREGPVTSDRAVEIGTGVAAALGAAHRAGVLHRDIKPGNVLLDERGKPKVADFGIAKSLGASALTNAATAAGTLLGTVAYLAPERLHGAPATPADDLWALGVVLYEALAGAKPYAGDTPAMVAAAIAAGSAPPLRQRRPDIDPDLANVVDQALSRNPAHRFSNAEAFATALASGTVGNGAPPTAQGEPTVVAATGEPTMIAPVGAGPLGTDTAARPRRRGAGLAWALAALVLLGALAFGAWTLGSSSSHKNPSSTSVPVAPTTTASPATAPSSTQPSTTQPATTASTPTTTTSTTTTTPTTSTTTTTTPTTTAKGHGHTANPKDQGGKGDQHGG